MPMQRGASEGRRIAVVGDVYRFLATGADTGGAYALWEALCAPGGGPPPHYHTREAEWFYVIEGQITFQLGEERVVATPGMFFHVPPGTLHAFRNETSQPARMLISVTPAGLEEMFFAVGTELPAEATIAAPPTAREIEKLVRLSGEYGVVISAAKG